MVHCSIGTRRSAAPAPRRCSTSARSSNRGLTFRASPTSPSSPTPSKAPTTSAPPAGTATRLSTRPRAVSSPSGWISLARPSSEPGGTTRVTAVAPTQAHSTAPLRTSLSAHPKDLAATGSWSSTMRRAASLRQESLHVLRRLALRPRVVLRSEPHPLADGRVRVQPELDERARGRIRQPDLAHDLERLGGRLLRIRHDSVDHLEAVYVGVVLLHADQRVRDRVREEAEDGHRHQ